MTEDILLAQILGHKLLGPNAALSVGQSCKDFYVTNPLGKLPHLPPIVYKPKVFESPHYTLRMRYRTEITAGSLKIQESRLIADLLLRGLSRGEWTETIRKGNLLQTRTVESAVRLARLIYSRLSAFDQVLWRMIRDAEKALATQALLAAAIKNSQLLGDFMDLVLRDEYRLFHTNLSSALWDSYLEGCRDRDPEMPIGKNRRDGVSDLPCSRSSLRLVTSETHGPEKSKTW